MDFFRRCHFEARHFLAVSTRKLAIPTQFQVETLRIEVKAQATAVQDVNEAL